ncbi:MAG: FAD binding domain-containing protein [Pseudomonas sp.]
MHAPKALIIGGSLGGLFAATALRAIGWEVEVFERSPDTLDSRGGGIVLQAAVLHTLAFAGIRPREPLGVRSKNRVYFDRLGNVEHQQYMPQSLTSWTTLYTTLLNAFGRAHYHRGAKLVGLTQHGRRVTAQFEDGRSAEGDLLIGADGGNSTVRSLMLPGMKPSYSGYVVWRGLVDEMQLPQAAKQQLYEDFVFQQDPQSLMLEYMVPGVDGSTAEGKRRFNWLWYLPVAPGAALDRVLSGRDGQRRGYSVSPGNLAPEQEAWIRTQGEARANPAFRELMRQTDEIFVQAIIDFKAPKMVFNRVLLTGDAAFIPRPHTAGSTAKAAANALALAKALDGSTDIEAALSRWQVQQLAEGALMGDRGVEMGNRIMGITFSAASCDR